GVNWSEKHISGPFDLDLAPDAEGLFLGDYQALASVGDNFVPFFVQTNNAGTDNRTDVYVLPPQASPLHSLRRTTYAVRPRPVAPPDAAFRNRIQQAIHRRLQSTRPGWKRIQAERHKAPRAP
ncbi:MAG TPA: hypothetical protein VFM15_00155, partial [Gammaproteobacteria bacterium]|nr:hypothetical protein [Gammaproteobacteria bacterium]